MFRNLEAELVRQNISKRELARLVGVSYSTLTQKMSGKAGFTLAEAFKVKSVLGDSNTIDTLFQHE